MVQDYISSLSPMGNTRNTLALLRGTMLMGGYEYTDLCVKMVNILMSHCNANGALAEPIENGLLDAAEIMRDAESFDMTYTSADVWIDSEL